MLREANASGALQDLSFTAAYDPGDRVTGWNRDDNYAGAHKQQTWAYDAAGNWAATNIDGTNIPRTNDPSDRAPAIGGGTLTYSTQSNLTKDESGQKYVWSIDNRLTKADLVAGDDITYEYDAFGRRVYCVQGKDTGQSEYLG